MEIVQASERRVFHKRSHTLERQETEIAALALIGQQAAGLPVPSVMGQSIDPEGPILVLSYEDGANLADLLTPSAYAPPLPPTYQRVKLPVRPSASELCPLLSEVGRAVRLLHNIRLDKFGKQVGEEPNPHRWNARAFTYQEFAHRSYMGYEKGFLSDALVQKIMEWADRETHRLIETEPPCLVHYDLHAGNIRVCSDPDTGAWRLRVLYDFELARGWLSEWDLAALVWDIRNIVEGADRVWGAFLEGYGPVESARLRLFEGLRAVSGVAYTDRYPEWGAWCLLLLLEMIEN